MIHDAERAWPRWSRCRPGGYIMLLPDARYKLDGDPGDCLWWAAGLRRFGPAEGQQPLP
jgi:hypothetical protein